MVKEEKTRTEIDEKYKWDLTLIYKNENEFDNDKNKFIKMIDDIVSYKGKITESAENLYNFLKLDEKMMTLISNLYLYAYCKKNEDVSNSENQKRYNEIVNIDSIYSDKTSFVMPELMKTDYSIIKKYILTYDLLDEFRFDLEKIYRYQKYTLSDNEEKLLSNISELQKKYESNFEIVLNSLMDFGYINDENNEKVKLTIGNYSKYIKSKNRRVRKEAFTNRGEAIKKFVNLYAIDFEGNLKCDSIIAKTKGYNSDLEMYLYDDGVTTEIYDNLISIADKNINILYKYYNLIKKISKIEDLQVYDLSAPLTDNHEKKYSIDVCKNMICNSLSILGDEYLSVIKEAFENNWIDFYPNKGKISGYYESAAFNGHPVVLANYNDDLNSVSSICHELGHAAHSYFSNKSNPNHLAQYKIIVAEVASLTNEVLLSNYILRNSNDKDEKLEAIENILDVFSNNFFGTLAEGAIFEREVHKRTFNNECLTEIDFNEIWQKINERFYGPNVIKNDLIKYNWARVPHFYSSFYYYKYSIGISCACYIAKRILSGDKEYLKKYLNFLTLGDSMMPLDELKTIDIDLSKKDVIEEAISYFDNLINEFEKIYNS